MPFKYTRYLTRRTGRDRWTVFGETPAGRREPLGKPLADKAAADTLTHNLTRTRAQYLEMIQRHADTA